MKIPFETMESLHRDFMASDSTYRTIMEAVEKRRHPNHIKRNIQATQIRLALARHRFALRSGYSVAEPDREPTNNKTKTAAKNKQTS